MSAFMLKLIAIITMTIDHTGAIIFKDIGILRMIGRLAFPIFAFLIANGYFHTKNLKKYILRLFVFALIAQYPFMLAFDIGNEMYLNIFFTLFLGLISIAMYDHVANKILGLFAVAALAYSATLLNTDYGYYGVLLIFCFFAFKDDFIKMSLSIISLNLAFSTINVFMYEYFSPAMYSQCLSCFSLIFIYCYNNRKGKSMKYLFYVFYPAHLLIIYGISKLI